MTTSLEMPDVMLQVQDPARARRATLADPLQGPAQGKKAFSTDLQGKAQVRKASSIDLHWNLKMIISITHLPVSSINHQLINSNKLIHPISRGMQHPHLFLINLKRKDTILFLLLIRLQTLHYNNQYSIQIRYKLNLRKQLIFLVLRPQLRMICSQICKQRLQMWIYQLIFLQNQVLLQDRSNLRWMCSQSFLNQHNHLHRFPSLVQRASTHR